MKKFYFLAALVAGTALTSCTSEDDLVLSPPEVNVEDSYAPIVFSSVKNNITRGDITGKDAADSLGGKFVVSGFKGTSTATVGSMVFDNYLVEWGENTANTTESNSSNWEYVDKGLIDHAKTNGITKQTIKYWDYSQTQYDFIAWSTGQHVTAIYTEPTGGTIPAGSVLVSNITPNSKTPNWTAGDNPTRPAYTITGSAEDLRQCYIADLVTVKKGTAGKYGEASGYNNPVTLKFRQLGTKVRIALYETVPGYSVKNVEFYSAAASNDASAANAKLFTTTENEIFTEGTYTIYFPTVDKPDTLDNNQAHIKFAPKDNTTQATTIDWGGMNYTIRESGEEFSDARYLGRTSNTASFAGSADENYYQVFLPNQNGTNLNLRVNYTLESIDGSKEIIVVKGATAQVPLIYTQWKPGYAYTYLFKISDKTNGYTGVYDPTKPDDTSVNSDPAGLFPITFDAVVMNAEDDKTQETITLVATPSITTYQNGSNVVNKNEYTVLTLNPNKPEITGEIYVTVNDADAATYELVTGLTVGTSPVANYYTKDANNNYIPCNPNDVAADGVAYYYKKEPALPNGKLAKLTDKVKLYTVAAGTTEAEVIDALQMQDDDTPTGVTVKGRNKVELTEAKDATDDTKSLLVLTDSVKYGVDGNAIRVGTDSAAKFVPVASTTYAFVYTKQEPNDANNIVKYQALAWSNFATGQTKYRYGYKETSATPSNTSYYDAQKDVNYYTRTGTGTEQDPYTYAIVESPFIGQGVSNLYLDNQGSTIASGYAVSGTTYYYTVDGGQHYIEATNVAIEDFAGNTEIGTMSGTTWTANDASLTKPADNTAYYKRTVKSGTGTEQDPYVYSYTYCVFLPLQVNGKYVIDENKYEEAKETAAVAGQTYFDMYTKNDGVYYTKVIKIDQ